MKSVFLATLALAAVSANAQPTPTSVSANPRAGQLFENDWVLMNWALKHFDRDHDILLSPAEALAAASEFRRIADANQDGRVTVLEYRQARAFILARY